MSDLLRCKSCGGVFERTQRDGAPYAHACPPVLVALTVQRNGRALTIPPSQFIDGDVELARDYGSRANARDENHPGRGFPAGAIRAEGNGIERV